MTKSQNGGASSSKSFKTFDNNGPSLWSDLDHDLLFSVMMQLGVIDFFAFSGVCKRWRSFARSNRNKFMGSRKPMLISFSNGTKKECYLEDHEGRRFKTILPHSSGRTCIGSTCSYLILYMRRTRDFWLVNPITGHELLFPGFPFYVSTDPTSVRAILSYLPSTSEWVFYISHKFSSVISFCLAGKQSSWRYLSSISPILDIHSFNGKVYTINNGSRLYEVGLDPVPTLTQLIMQNFPQPDLLRPEFVSSAQNLYVMNCICKNVYETHEIDFEKMEWVSAEKTIKEYAIFVSDLKSSAAINPDTWDDPRAQCERFGYFKGTDKSQNECRWFKTNMWYFPQDCLDLNYLQ